MKYKVGDIVTFVKLIYNSVEIEINSVEIEINSVGTIKKIDPNCHKKLIYQVDFKDFGLFWIMEEEICDLSVFKELGD